MNSYFSFLPNSQPPSSFPMADPHVNLDDEAGASETSRQKSGLGAWV